MGSILKLLIAGILTLSVSARAVEFVNVEFGVCRDFPIYRPLNVYKEPTQFLVLLNRIQMDPVAGMKELAKESALLSTLSGVVKMKIGRPETFKNFNVISQLYEVADPRLHVENEAGEGSAIIHMVQLCKTGEPGFVLQQDLESAQRPLHGQHSLPPSTKANPIPQLPQ